MSLSGKVALVTGAATGIGFKYVSALLANGVKNVSIVDLDESNGIKAAKELNAKFGEGRSLFIKANITDKDQFEAAFEKTVNAFKGLDIVTNNAGIMQEKRWEEEIDLNFKALVRGTLLGFQYMGKDKGGKGGAVLNVSSILGLTSLGELAVYVGTKHAVIGVSRSFGEPVHYDKTGVRVLTVCPGATNTELLRESPKRQMDNELGEELSKKIETLIHQKPDNVANAMIHILNKGDSGSVWVSKNNEPPFLVSFPKVEI